MGSGLVVVLAGFAMLYLVGTNVAAENYGMAAMIVGAFVGLLVLLRLSKSARVEVVPLSFLLFGYLVAGRGFAYLSVGGIFIGEMVMVAFFLMTILRFSSGHFSFPRSKIIIPIVVFICLGSISFVARDFYQYRNLIVIRDFCLIYYSAYLFMTYSLCDDPESYNFLRKVYVFAIFVAVPVTAVEIFLPQLLWHNDLISRVKDTSGFSMICAALYFGFEAHDNLPKRTLYTLISTACIAMLFMTEARSAYIAIAFCFMAIILAGRIRLFAPQILAMIVGGAIFISVGLSIRKFYPKSKIVRVTEHVISVVDINDKLGVRKDEDDTNAWRLLWWQTIWDEIQESNQKLLFGQGFGYHLGEMFAERMMQDIFDMPVIEGYGLGEQYEARSPHCVFFTVLGRMGVVGAFIFCIILLLLIIKSFSIALQVRRGVQDEKALFWFLLPVCLLIEGLFSVVIEGPYGGIPYWALLGAAFNDMDRNRYKINYEENEPESENPFHSIHEIPEQEIPGQRGETPAYQ